MHIIRKDATIEATGDAGDMPGTFEVILSAPTLDRDGDTLLPDEWKQPLPEHITFDSDHGMSVATTVGSGVPELDDEGRLIVKGTFSSLPRAQEVRTLVNEGHIRTTSVAFMTVSDGKGSGSKKVRELLNGAFVAIPSNREALVLSSKSAQKAGARNSAADASLIQAIIDAALSLGGTVPEGKSASGVIPMKALVGSLEALQEAAVQLLREANEGSYVWLRGTIPAEGGGGTLVFEVEDPDTYATELYRQAYTDSDGALTLSGEREVVGVSEVLTPSTPEEEQAPPSTDGADDDPAAGAQAPAAGSRSAPATDEEAAIQIQAARIRAMSQIASATTTERN